MRAACSGENVADHRGERERGDRVGEHAVRRRPSLAQAFAMPTAARPWRWNRRCARAGPTAPPPTSSDHAAMALADHRAERRADGVDRAGEMHRPDRVALAVVERGERAGMEVAGAGDHRVDPAEAVQRRRGDALAGAAEDTSSTQATASPRPVPALRRSPGASSRPPRRRYRPAPARRRAGRCRGHRRGRARRQRRSGSSPGRRSRSRSLTLRQGEDDHTGAPVTPRRDRPKPPVATATYCRPSTR